MAPASSAPFTETVRWSRSSPIRAPIEKASPKHHDRDDDGQHLLDEEPPAREGPGQQEIERSSRLLAAQQSPTEDHHEDTEDEREEEAIAKGDEAGGGSDLHRIVEKDKRLVVGEGGDLRWIDLLEGLVTRHRHQRDDYAPDEDRPALIAQRLEEDRAEHHVVRLPAASGS